MDNFLTPLPDRKTSRLTFKEVEKKKEEIVWKKMAELKVGELLELWLNTLGYHTARTYRSGVNQLTGQHLIYPELSLQQFAIIPHNEVIDRIKQVEQWSENTRQGRAALYISFTKYLARRYEGIIKPAVPNRENKTFRKVRKQVLTPAMNLKQLGEFLAALETKNPRDALIAKLQTQGGKRINEVLSLKIDQINWSGGEITFRQSKTGGTEEITIITYPESVFEQLENYLKGRQSGLVFLTKNENPVHYQQLERAYIRAGKKAGIGFKVNTHVLRATCVTYFKDQGFKDSEIAKITGQSLQTLAMYDKREIADNPSKRVSVV